MISKLRFILPILFMLATARSFAQASHISYSSPQVYTMGVAITPVTPGNTGGPVNGSFSASPVLPNGLAIDSETGVISGTPTAVSAATTYTIYVSDVGLPGGGGDIDGNPNGPNSGATDSAKINITVNAPSTNASLSNFQVSNGTLSTAFAAGTYNYSINVGYGLKTMTVTPTATDATATIAINGAAIASGTPSSYLPLVVGANMVTTVVTAQDGSATQTYKLTINEARSSNNTLAGLKISSGTLTPAFSAGTTNYTASETSPVSSMTITPTAADPTATIEVNSTTVTPGRASGDIALNDGANTISTVVTAQNGTTKTYIITVTRATPSGNDNLSGINLSKGTLSPAFAGGTTSYTDAVTNGTASITLTPTAADAAATITVNGTAVTSRKASGPIALNVGSNTITIIVTAPDGAATQTYSVNVIRSSTNAKLAGLTLSSGTLSPAFNANRTSYTTLAPYPASSINLTPTVAVAGATVKVNGKAVISGSPAGAMGLSVGANAFTIVVTAQDGVTTATYNLTVTRAGPSANDNLSNLTISKGTLSPAFATATAAYTDMVTNGTASLTITPTIQDATATITVNGAAVISGKASGAVALEVGSNPIGIAVTAQDGVTTQTYMVNVIRPSTNARLANLTTNDGALSPTFNPATTGYTLSVSNATASISVTPTIAAAGATVKVNGTTVESGTPSAVISLSVGGNSIITMVTAQNGVTTDTYTLTVTRAASTDNIPDAAVNVGVQNFEPLTYEDGITVHQGISPNGDGINDFLKIDNIANYPNNKLTIMNLNGQLVYESKGYDNATKVFDGHSNKNGQMQLPGTYFFSLDYTVNGIIKHKTGFLVLKY